MVETDSYQAEIFKIKSLTFVDTFFIDKYSIKSHEPPPAATLELLKFLMQKKLTNFRVRNDPFAILQELQIYEMIYLHFCPINQEMLERKTLSIYLQIIGI